MLICKSAKIGCIKNISFFQGLQTSHGKTIYFNARKKTFSTANEDNDLIKNGELKINQNEKKLQENSEENKISTTTATSDPLLNSTAVTSSSTSSSTHLDTNPGTTPGEQMLYKMQNMLRSTVPYEQRIEYLNKIISPDNPVAKVVPVTVCKDLEHMYDMLIDVVSEGGEGLILREPGSFYQGGRNNSMLKVKPQYLALGFVTKLRTANETLHIKNTFGIEFKLFQQASQAKYPNIRTGSLIEYRFTGFSPFGKPRTAIITRLFDNLPKTKFEPL